MPRMEVQIRELKEQLKQAQDTIRQQNDRINDLLRQLQGKVQDSQYYKSQISSYETSILILQGQASTAEYQLANREADLDNAKQEIRIIQGRYDRTEKRLAEAQAENDRLRKALAAAEQEKVDRKHAEEAEAMRKCHDTMMQAIDQPADDPDDITVIAGKTGIITIAKHDRRGGKRKIDLEQRQYARELRKIKTWDGKPVNSIKSISDIIGLSKTQTFAVLQEPDIPGRWYSQDGDGSRTYYDDYITAAHSKRPIHFQPDKPNE